MISLLHVEPSGAVRVILTPPTNAQLWRVLRKPTDTFAGESDPAATLIDETPWERAPVDDGAVLGAVNYYRAYYYDGAVWTASTTKSVTPTATYQDHSVDPYAVVRDRLDAGFVEELARGTLQHKDNKIAVLNSPPQFDATAFPVVTVLLMEDAPEVRGIGEAVHEDWRDGDDWLSPEGWPARVRLTITGWSLNPDERIALRKAIRRILMANLPTFEGLGVQQVEFKQSDREDLERYTAPIYLSVTEFSCLAGEMVTGRTGDVDTVEVNLETTDGQG